VSETFEALKEELRIALGPEPAPWLRVDVLFRKLLSNKDSRASQMALDVLHGKYGPDFSRFAWKSMQDGLPLHFQQFASQGSSTNSLTALCVKRDTVATFEAVVQAGAPASVPTDFKPRSQREWIDLVSSTASKRSALSLELKAHPNKTPFGAVGEIANIADAFPAAAREAFEVVWRLDPNHPGFHALAQVSSEPGDAVRAFLMSKRMAQAAQEQPACESPVSSPRRRRVSI